MSVVGMQSWGECAHHFGQFNTQSTAHSHDGRATTEDEIPAFVRLPMDCGQQQNVEPSNSDSDHENEGTHHCQCGDLSCVVGDSIAAPVEIASVEHSHEWPQHQQEFVATNVVFRYLHARAVLPLATAPPSFTA